MKIPTISGRLAPHFLERFNWKHYCLWHWVQGTFVWDQGGEAQVWLAEPVRAEWLGHKCTQRVSSQGYWRDCQLQRGEEGSGGHLVQDEQRLWEVQWDWAHGWRCATGWHSGWWERCSACLTARCWGVGHICQHHWGWHQHMQPTLPPTSSMTTPRCWMTQPLRTTLLPHLDVDLLHPLTWAPVERRHFDWQKDFYSPNKKVSFLSLREEEVLRTLNVKSQTHLTPTLYLWLHQPPASEQCQH